LEDQLHDQLDRATAPPVESGESVTEVPECQCHPGPGPMPGPTSSLTSPLNTQETPQESASERIWILYLPRVHPLLTD